MTSNSETDHGFQTWSQSREMQNYQRTNFPNAKENHHSLQRHLRRRWNGLSAAERQYWQEQTKTKASNWIQDGVVKRCGSHYIWEEGTVMVAKCRHDGFWYLVDNQYRKGSQIDGDWPQVEIQNQTRQAAQAEVSLRIKWTDDGLRLRFKYQPLSDPSDQ